MSCGYSNGTVLVSDSNKYHKICFGAKYNKKKTPKKHFGLFPAVARHTHTLSIWADRLEQSVQTQIKLLLKKELLMSLNPCPAE